MKHLAAAILGFALLCAAPADARRVSDYTPAEMRHMEAAARAGDVAAMVDLGSAYISGRAPGGKTDRASAIYWLHKAANLGSAEAQMVLGSIYAYRSDPNHPYDETRAFLWYQRAAENGNVYAQGSLAAIYERSATRADYVKGYRWTLKAALQGDDSAVIRLQTLYVYKEDVASFDAALEKLSTAADLGDADAQWRLASIFLMGQAGHKDDTLARALAEKAAAQNRPEGYYLLSFLMPPGPATREARTALVRKAADAGYVPAQMMWMLDYDPPEGMKPADDPNERLIFDWLAAAAEKGWPMAQEPYSGYFRSGLFVAEYPVESYKWLLIARYLPYHRFRIVDLWARTDAEPYEIEARRRAEAWLKAHPKSYWQEE